MAHMRFLRGRVGTAPADARAARAARAAPSLAPKSMRLPGKENPAFEGEWRSPARRPAARAPSAVSSRDVVARTLSAAIASGDALLAEVDAARDQAALGTLVARLAAPERDVALLWAAYTGRREAVAALLAAAANPRYLPDNARCFSALHYAALGGNARICELLLAAGAEPQLARAGYSPLDFAVLGRSADAAAVLAARGASADACRAALTLAVQMDALECVEILLPHCGGSFDAPVVDDCSDASVDASVCDGYSALHLAAEAGNTRCVRALLAAATAALPAMAPALAARTLDRDETPLHLAARGGFGACAAALLAKGADAGARNARGQTPLHLAAQAHSARCVRALLAAPGCDPDARDADERTPLHYLRTLQNSEVTRLLLEAGADASARDRYGYTPLHVAAQNELVSSSRALLHCGANVTARTAAGVTALAGVVRKVPCALSGLYARLDAAISLQDANSTVLEAASSTQDGHDAHTGNDDAVVSLNFRPLLEHSAPGEISYLKTFIDEGHKDILKHPLCQAFLHYKWGQIKKFYIIKILFYLLLVLSLTVYVISAETTLYNRRRQAYQLSQKSQNLSCDSLNSLCKEATSFAKLIVSVPGIVEVSHAVFSTFVFLELFRKACGCSGYASMWEYVSYLDNVLEWVVAGSAFVLVSSTWHEKHCMDDKDECFQEHLGAVTLLLVYFMLMRMVGHLPPLQCYVAMYFSVLRLFVRVLAAYLCLLLGFVFAFCAAFPGLAEFANPAMGIVRAIGMMSGEILFQNTFLENQRGGLTGTSQIMFLVFVLFVTIVLMNLLVGLAVNDIQGLQTTADLLQLQQKTRLISQTERALLNAWLPARLRLLLARHACVSPGRYRKVFHVRPLSHRERRLPPQLLAAVYALSRQPASSPFAACAVVNGKNSPTSDTVSLASTLPVPNTGLDNPPSPVASAAAVEQLAADVAHLRRSLEIVLEILNGRATEC